MLKFEAMSVGQTWVNYVVANLGKYGVINKAFKSFIKEKCRENCLLCMYSYLSNYMHV